MHIKQLTLAFVLILSFACGESSETKKDTPKDSPVAEQDAVSNKKVAFYINDRPVYEDSLINRNIDYTINNEIIYEGALLEKLDTDPTIEAKVADFKKNLIIGTLKGRVIDKYLADNQVTDEAINNYYEQNKDEFTYLDVVEIKSADKAKIDELLTSLSAGTPLEKALNELQDDSITKRDVKNTREYKNKFKNLEIGAVSDTYTRGVFNYVAQITNVTVIPLKQVKTRIRMNLTNKIRSDAITEYVKKVQSENNINIKRVN